MRNCNNKIGLAFTGDSKTLKSFFLNCASKNSEKSSFLHLLKHEIIKGKNYYSFVEEKLEWNTEAELERRAVCRAADEAKLSFHFCYFNTESLETTVKTNKESPYFDHDVLYLFDVSTKVE